MDTIDSALIIKCKNNLIVNLNDTICDPSKKFIKQEISKCKHSLLLKLAGYGDADMINIYNHEKKFIEPIAASKPAPGEILTSQAKKIGCTHAMHFSSFHKYVRTDSLWANSYTTPEKDLKRGWDQKIGYYQQFSSISLTSNGFKKIDSIYPEYNNVSIDPPEKFNDYWDQDPSVEDIKLIKKYLAQIREVGNESFKIKVGKKIISADKSFDNTLTDKKFIIHAPRNSLVRAIRLNIFDDLLIGNFAKLIIYSKQKSNYRKTLKFASKYIDNLEIKNAEELKTFLWIYRNSYDNKYQAISSDLKSKARDYFITKFNGNLNFLRKLKLIYQKL